MPLDPQRTLAEAREEGVLLVGHAYATPEELAAVRGFARSLGLEVQLRNASASELLSRLERFELDAVVAGLSPDDPWRRRVAFSRAIPVADGQRVIALPPGENRLALELDRHLVRAR